MNGLILTGLRVLVIDDDRDSRDLLITALEVEGAEVVAVDSAAAALKCVHQFTPSIVVSDIRMPDKDGYTLIRELRTTQSGRALPAIAVTAYARPEDRVEALEAGFQVHLTKPVDIDELIATIARLTHVRQK
jgi:two-component system, OmpR family, response regulator